MTVNRGNCGLSAEIVTDLIVRWRQLKANRQFDRAVFWMVRR
ncbi:MULTISPECIES: hypothetical protein [unclassified Microcoleus]